MRSKTILIYERTLAANNGTPWDFDKYIDIPFLVKRIELSAAYYHRSATAASTLSSIYSSLFSIEDGNGIACLIENRTSLQTSVEYVFAVPKIVRNLHKFRLIDNPAINTLRNQNTDDILSLTLTFYDQ